MSALIALQTELHQTILDALSSPERLVDDECFDDLVQRIHAFQCQSLEPLRRLALHQGRGPEQVKHWQQLPSVPSQAYKRYELYSGCEPCVRTFQSSGTTATSPPGVGTLSGTGAVTSVSKAAYSMQGLQLMDRVIYLNAQRMLFPDMMSDSLHECSDAVTTEGAIPSGLQAEPSSSGRASQKPQILVLAPPPSAAPGMIMAYGMQRLIGEFGAEGSRFLLGPGGIEPAALGTFLARATEKGIPITLIGASFGFVHLLDGLNAQGLRLQLPPGSRTMDAGGFKGRSREVSGEWMQGQVAEWLGVPATHVINLLGMTELPSQLYDDRLAAHLQDRKPLLGKRIPPWMRVQVLEPQSLQPCAPGQPGLIRVVDLANLERPLSLLSDDVGVLFADGSLKVLGRATGADARGCSLSIEEWMAANA